MGNCPFHTDDDTRGTDDRRQEDAARPREDQLEPDGTPPDGGGHGWGAGAAIGRRAFVRSAVAIGGLNALTAVLGAETDTTDPAAMPYPNGDPAARPERQHLWSDAGYADAFGNPTAPRHQLVLLLDYVGDDLDADRAALESLFTGLERAFTYDQREGLLFVVGYSPAYFKRHAHGVPRGVDITEPRAVSPHNTPRLDRQDIFVQLASDEAAIVMAAEACLLGELDELNGVTVTGSMDGVCEARDRRAVFVGTEDDEHGEPQGLPAANIDSDDIDPRAPLSMGFDSLFADSIPPEENVTITDGPWTDGTVAMVSTLALRLDEWYGDLDRAERVEQMFAPGYTPEDVGEFGEGLGEGSGREDGESWPAELTDRLDEDARDRGVVGHAQKVTRARDDEFEVTLLRRDGNITVDGGGGGLSFVGLVEGISDWFAMGEAMYDSALDRTLAAHDGDEPAAGRDGHHPRSGIASHVDVLSRGHYLVPPRSLRSLPPSAP